MHSNRIAGVMQEGVGIQNYVATLESVYAFQLRVSGVVLQEGVVIQCYVAIREGGLLGHIWINDRARGCVRIVHNMR